PGAAGPARTGPSAWTPPDARSLKFDENRTYYSCRTKRKPSAMLGTVMDDVIEPAAEDFRLPQVLAALADPHRLATVRFVARHGESWCSQVMQEAGLEMSKSTFSHHLRILR